MSNFFFIWGEKRLKPPQCRRCLLSLFSVSGGIGPQEPRDSLEAPLQAFFSHSSTVHFDALLRHSSVFAATEQFICEHAGQIVVLTAFSVLRKEYDLAMSPAARLPATSAVQAAREDLVFDYMITANATGPTTVHGFLHHQYAVNLLGSERTKRAAWDLSRLLPASHSPGNATFAWLERTLFPVDTV